MSAINGGFIRRPELTALVEEAKGLEKMFLAERLFPVKGVDTEGGDYWKFEKGTGNLLRAAGGRREPKAAYARVERALSKDNYRTLEYGLEEPIDEAQKKSVADILDLEEAAGRLVKRSLMLLHEKRVKDVIFTPGNWSQGTTAPVAAYTEANIETIDFVRDIEGLLEKAQNYGVLMNTVVLSSYVWKRVRHSKLLRAALFGTNNDKLPTLKDVENSDLFDVPLKFEVARMPEDVSAQGAAAVQIVRIWPTTHIALLNVQSGDWSAGGAGRTLVWDADSPGGLYTSESYEEPKIRSTTVRVRSHAAEKVIDPDSGMLLTTNYA